MDYGNTWTDMFYKGEERTIDIDFEFSAWVDCYDPTDSRSEFYEWEHNILHVWYLTEDGNEIPIHLEHLEQKQLDIINSAIDRAIHNELV